MSSFFVDAREPSLTRFKGIAHIDLEKGGLIVNQRGVAFGAAPDDEKTDH
jgi:hypothetical protein